MTHEIDIKRVRDKALDLIPKEHEYKFLRDFDNETAFDIMDDPESYIAEGAVSFYLNCINNV